ncbi:hypothetical protein Ancab_007871, partial [Ancistrocladus abbreviatus]
NQVELAQQLDGVWIGGQKLSVKIANSRESPTLPARRRKGLSFAEVIRGVDTLRPNKLMGTKEQAFHSVVSSSSSREFPSNKGVIYKDDIES